MNFYNFQSDKNETLVALYYFNNIQFWKFIKNKNFYGIFLFEDQQEIQLEFEGTIINSTHTSVLFYYPYQKLEFLKNSKGQLLVFHPNYFCLDVEGKELGCQGVLFQNILKTSHYNLSAINFELLKTGFQEIQLEIESKAIGSYQFISNLISILLLKCLRIIHQINAETITPLTPILQFKTLLNQKVTTNHQPSFYATHLGLNTKQLNLLVKENLGKTTQQIINEKLIALAKSKLFNTQLIVKEIAFDLGFEDPLYFSRIFKLHTGVSPKEFRNNLREKFIEDLQNTSQL
ncbi:helix-turn-helix domain-containing protein [Flavobacterium sp.]|uniref:helix-turn-helix domain-containing protein n=1 Tax=Flavobacterium sp. TaxID=239 RepID=UPI003D11BFD8